MITLDRAGKAFDGFWAVKELSIEVADGEIFGLVGPNGAGKTTTIKMMTGLLRPDAGKITIGRHDIVRDDMKAKAVSGYVPDKAFFYEKLTAREFLLFISSVYKVERSEAFSRIERLLGLFGIRDAGDELIESFSQGMRQRLLFSAALIHDPEVLVIDEPFMGLDPFGVSLLKEVIADLAGKGRTVFLATHSLHLAEEICHRVGFIHRGILTSVKARDEIRSAEGGLEGLFMKITG